ncbi:hypothetical protein Ae356Ps1_6226c [Pseudonocardia sp. Ae356_Ps1]|nr:hypothetical protein Ae356Ps1_6226c [Pseudonocardia sp. Ae356_Ps1]
MTVSRVSHRVRDAVKSSASPGPSPGGARDALDAPDGITDKDTGRDALKAVRR